MKSALYRALVLSACLCASSYVHADIPLIGNNLPGGSLMDGDFDTIRASWRQAKQSPFWTAKHVPGKGKNKMGLASGKLSGGGNAVAVYESHLVCQNSEYTKPVAGDVLAWEFASRAEYPCDAYVIFSLVFGGQEHVLADRVSVPGGKVNNAVFGSRYKITEEDAQQGDFYVRMTLYSSHQVKVFVDYVDLKVQRAETAGPKDLEASTVDSGVQLSWSSDDSDTRYNVYRSDSARKGFKRIASDVKGATYTDENIINGLTNCYIVTRVGEAESSASPVASARKVDRIAPPAPNAVKANGDDVTVQLSWKCDAKDIASYNVLRGDAEGQGMIRIAHNVKKSAYEDGLIVEFDGIGNGISEQNFTCKLIARTTSDELIVGYTHLSAK